MKQQTQINRLNYAMTKHHREQLREQIDPDIINNIECSQHPALNYKQAFRGVYQDQLEKTLLQHRIKKETGRVINDPQTNRLSYNQDSCQKPNNSNIRNTFIDYEGQKLKRYDSFIQKQVNDGHSFFRSQDQYTFRKNQQKETNKRILNEQLRMKQQQKMWGVHQREIEMNEVKSNRVRQVQSQLMAKEKNKNAWHMHQQMLKEQMENQLQRKHRKPIVDEKQNFRHNPITNPIEYHIDNPYILQKMHRAENPYGVR